MQRLRFPPLSRRNFSKFPVAILTTAATDSVANTNVQNLRTYTFEIVVLVKAEEITSPTQIEDLIENILNKFDNDPTLKAGTGISAADGAVEPSTSSPEAVTSGSNDYIVFSVNLRVRAIRDLTFE